MIAQGDDAEYSMLLLSVQKSVRIGVLRRLCKSAVTKALSICDVKQT
jgi:hypothetical protein